MKPQIILAYFSLAILMASCQKAEVKEIPYGNNPEAGNYITIKGAKQYYEVYGQGQPLVLIHGNGGNIAYLAPQIKYFSKDYKVIAMDCRGRGKSELGSDSLTYMQMADDITAILDQLNIDSAYVVGRSDGGILALLLAIYHPQKVKKAVAFAANLTPDTVGLYPSVYYGMVAERKHADSMLAVHDTTKNWELIRQRMRMMEFQPHITAADLHRITCPVLVMSVDRDLIPVEHTLNIYRNIEKGDLCILDGAHHSVSKDEPALFNQAVTRYLTRPFMPKEQRD